jgi:GT2 family glycosyltransferase
MSISCVITNYNGDSRLKTTVNYALKYSDEVIVIDDCSTDNSLKEIRKIKNKRLRIYKNERNSGASYSRNRGYKIARNDRILFLDNDCYLKKKDFEKLLKYKEDIVYPKIIDINGKVYNHYAGQKYIHNSVCFLIIKQLFARAGCFDENIRIYMDDVDFFYRCYKCGLSEKCVLGSVGFHDSKKSTANVSKNFFLNLQNTVYFCIKNRRFFQSDGFPNILTIFANIRRCVINKDRLYGLRLADKRTQALIMGLRSIYNGILLYYKSR